MIINIRGTGGSGKSTLVRRVMEAHPGECVTMTSTGRKRPIGYRFETRPLLFVPGHYETACGGCDTIKTVDEVYRLVREWSSRGYHVLYEGIMVMDDVTRAVALSKDVAGEFVVIGLTTPIDDCLDAIRARRVERGDEKPLDPKNTRDRDRRCRAGLGRLADAGVRVERLDREAAFVRCRELLNMRRD